ncbi:hypothetical protein BH23GEM8_BH23GEM8_04740 [soil metagenome]
MKHERPDSSRVGALVPWKLNDGGRLSVNP